MNRPSFDLPPEELRRLGALAADAVASHRERLLDLPVFGKVGARAALFDEPDAYCAWYSVPEEYSESAEYASQEECPRSEDSGNPGGTIPLELEATE